MPGLTPATTPGEAPHLTPRQFSNRPHHPRSLSCGRPVRGLTPPGKEGILGVSFMGNGSRGQSVSSVSYRWRTGAQRHSVDWLRFSHWPEPETAQGPAPLADAAGPGQGLLPLLAPEMLQIISVPTDSCHSRPGAKAVEWGPAQGKVPSPNAGSSNWDGGPGTGQVW